MRISEGSSDVCSSDLDAGGDERAHQAFGENTHYKSFPGSAIPSLVEIGCFGEKTSRLPIALHEPKATRRNERIHRRTERLLPHRRRRARTTPMQIGRAAVRERGCQSVLILVVAVTLKKKTYKHNRQSTKTQ